MKEIERKFLVTSDKWRAGAKGVIFRQGYLSSGETTVRVRIAGKDAFLTIKGPPTGISRDEFEYSIPVQEAEQMMALCHGPIIEKTRYFLPIPPHTWEIDVFEGDNEGLTVAEIELNRDDEAFESPPWLGKEVSHDRRYTNAALSLHPFGSW